MGNQISNNESQIVLNATAAPVIDDEYLVEGHTLTEELKNKGLVKNPGWWYSRRNRGLVLLFLLFLCMASGALYHQAFRELITSSMLPNGAQLAMTLVAVVGGCFAYYKWLDTRRDDTRNGFYERLRITNEFVIDSPATKKLMEGIWGGASDKDLFECSMYICLELDNLEYVLFQHEYGFVSEKLLERSLRLFDSRCMTLDFGVNANKIVRIAGYDPRTIETVNHLFLRNFKITDNNIN